MPGISLPKSKLGYQWKINECNAGGIPYVKLAPVVLERDGARKRFNTQREVDAAWDDGWHDTGRPETAEVLKPKAEHIKLYPKSPKRMPAPVLRQYMAEMGLEWHESMTNTEMELDLINAIAKRKSDEETESDGPSGRLSEE